MEAFTGGKLADATRPRVAMVAADNPAEALDLLMEEAHRESESQIIRITFDKLPPATEQQAALLNELNAAACRMGPLWYGGKLTADFQRVTAVTDAELVSAMGTMPAVSLRWIRAAVATRLNESTALPKGFTDIEHFRQLALVFGDAPNLVVGVLDVAEPPERVQALVRVCEMLQTAFQVTLVVPTQIASITELDPISYEHRRLGTAGGSVASQQVTAKSADEPIPSFLSFAGLPHPESPGEQKVAKWLAQDSELSSLFRFNQPLTTLRNSRYRVDLLWLAGRLVIEIDGYKTHTTEHQFRMDRQRDYELALTGFSVLRLTHQEVMQDVALAGEKIRDLVRFQAGRIPTAMTQGDA
jgi:very-short-patch-repair endonuclease